MATFVLIPGAGGHAAYWNRLVPELETRGHGAIAVDIKEDDPSIDLHGFAGIVEAAIELDVDLIGMPSQRTPQAPDLGPRVAKAADVGAALTLSAPRTGLPPLTLPPESANRRRIRPAAQPFPSQQSGEFNDLLFLARMFTGIGPK